VQWLVCAHRHAFLFDFTVVQMSLMALIRLQLQCYYFSSSNVDCFVDKGFVVVVVVVMLTAQCICDLMIVTS